jgi:hypothetical protein
MNKLTFSDKQIESILIDQLETGDDDFTASCKWLKANPATWTKWVPDATECLPGQGLVDALGEYVYNKSVALECARCKPGYFSEWVEKDGEANYLCNPCTPGLFANAFGVLECSLCEIGMYSGFGQATCFRCEMGTYADQQGTSECTTCDASFVTLFQGATTKLDCICGPDTYLNDQHSCSQCMEGSGLVCKGDKERPGDTLPVLEPGHMALPFGNQDSARLLSPSEDSTKEQNVSKLAMPPFRLSTYMCQMDRDCPGGKTPYTWEDVCFGGRSGIACGKCQEGDYMDGEGKCEVCEPDAAKNTYLCFMLLPLVCLHLYRSLNKDNTETDGEQEEEAEEEEQGEVKRTLSASEEAQQEKKERAEKFCNKHLLKDIIAMVVLFNDQVVSVVSDCFGLLLEFIQAAQLLTSLADLPTQKKIMVFGGLDLQALGLLLMFDVNKLMDLLGIRLQCVTGHTFQSRYGVELMVPLVIILCFLMNFLLFSICIKPMQHRLREKVRGKKKGLCNKIMRTIAYAEMCGDKIVNALGTQVTVLFIGLTSLAMSIHVTFAHPPDGGPPRYSLRRFPDVLKDSDERASMMPISTLALLVYTFGVVAGAFYVCWVAPVKAHQLRFRIRYFFLLDGFRPQRWWWGFVILMKALLMNIALVMFASAKTQNVFLAVLFMGSLAMLFSFSPWPKLIQNIIDTVGHIACAMLLATTSYFIPATADDSQDTILGVAMGSMFAPLIIAICCMALPLYQFVVRRSRAINVYRFGQRFRDLLLLVTRRNNNEINVFLNSLDDSDIMAIDGAMNVLYTRMFFMHPSKKFAGDRIIHENPEYLVATDMVVQQKLEHDITVENRNDFTSLQERTLMQWFVEQIIQGSTSGKVAHGLEDGQCNVNDHGLTLGGLFNYLDEHDIGKINKDDFTRNAMKLSSEISEDVCGRVFDLMDLDEGGFIDRDEFDIIMSGMTFSGQGLDGDTKEGKYLRQQIPKNELESQRNTTDRLSKRMSVMKEDGNKEAVATPVKEPVEEKQVLLIL